MSDLISVRKMTVGAGGVVGKNLTAYSDAVNLWRSTGYCSLLITVSAGSITASMQASSDGVSWFDAVDSKNRSLGAVVTAMSAGSKYIQFAPILAPWWRFKFVELNVASSVVQAELIFQESP